MDETQCLRMIRASLAPSTGCTEPAAIALNAATARKAAQGTVTQVTARLDAYLFKNAMGVGIPGADERGVDLCVALGITAGDADAGMNALHTVTAEQLAAAKALRGCVKVEIVDGVSGLYIETILRTDCDAVRVVTVGAHDHIALVEHAPFTEAPAEQESVEEGGAHCGSLAEFIAFADTVALDKLAFLRDALTMNRTIYDRAMSDELAHCVLPKITLDDPSLCASAKRMAGAASYARMHGVPLPVMTATGSGNQGITLFLTVDAAARYFSIPEEKELRAGGAGERVHQKLHRPPVERVRVRRGVRLERVAGGRVPAGRRRRRDGAGCAEYLGLCQRHDLRRREGGLREQGCPERGACGGSGVSGAGRRRHPRAGRHSG